MAARRAFDTLRRRCLTHRGGGEPGSPASLRLRWTRAGRWSLVACCLVAALLQACRFAAQPAHVIEILAAHHVVAHDLDLVDLRRMQHEAALDADVMRDTADGEGAAHRVAV